MSAAAMFINNDKHLMCQHHAEKQSSHGVCRQEPACTSCAGGKKETQACIKGKCTMARMWASRQGGYLAYSLQCLVIYICTALETEMRQMLQLNQLPQAFAGHLQTHYS